MEPPASAPPTSNTTATSNAPLSAPPYPDSLDSSPRSRTTDTWEGGVGDSLPPVPGGAKLRLMCSYGGHIVPRPHDKSLCYVGGETRIVVVERNSSLPELLQRLSKILLNGRPFTLKYQLPNEDLDSLITVSSEEDLENMIDEYDRLNAGPNPARNSRIRLFLFPTRLDVAASMGPILDGSNKSDDWFLNVLNSGDLLERGFSDPSAVNTLLGLEENGRSSRNLDLNSNEGEGQAVAGGGMGAGRGKVGNMSNPDVHSVVDSSIAETNSSFGSASSSPAMLNLPRIRVHVEEGAGGGGGGARVFDHRIGIEDQFAQMGVNAHKQEEGFVMMSSPPSNLPVTGAPVGVPGDYTNRFVSDEERSDHGAPVGYQTRQPPQLVTVSNSQPQNKQITEDLPSPAASVSSDCSNLSNTNNRQKPLYQDPSGNNRLPANFVDPRMGFTDTSVQVQQASDSGYVLPSHYDQLQQQSIQSQQQQQQQQHQQAQQQAQHAQAQQQAQHAQAQQQAQQFIHASNQYVHHHPAGGVPLSYYPVYPSQQPQNHQGQPIDQRYPVYYVPAGQTHAYNLPVQQQQQPNYTEAANATRMMAPPQKPEIPQAGVYRAAANASNPPLAQMPQQQQQFMGYPQMHHHPSQSMAPASAAGQYAYELSDPAHAQVYFTQPPLAPQYQTMNPGPAMVLPDAPAASPNDNAKQQIRTSQPL